jgi:hypothetical protein
MGLHLDKFVHTETGKRIMSILLGFGLASLFRTVCQNKNCFNFKAPPLEQIEGKIYKNNNGKCIKYSQIATKCDSKMKTIYFE